MKQIIPIIVLMVFSRGESNMATKNQFTEDQKLHHYMGIEMNIQTWNLLGKDNRNEQDDQRMISFAKASLFHWRLSPKYLPVNEQRGQWMISRIYAVLGKGEEAMKYAKETLRLTEEHGFKDFDLAYAYESMARAHAAMANNEDCGKWYNKALNAGELINGAEDKKYYKSDLKSGPWFNCI